MSTTTTTTIQVLISQAEFNEQLAVVVLLGGFIGILFFLFNLFIKGLR